MKIGILTQYYPPEVGAPQGRLSDLARRLAGWGYDVHVLTAMPSYPQGKIYPGYGGVLRREQMEGVEVIRTAIYPSQKASLAPRLANYFSFVASSWLVGGWQLPRLDYLLTESPPLFLGMAGYLISRWKRAKWIFNVSDLWPESAVRLGYLKVGLSLKASTWLEAACYRNAWAVTGQSASIVEDIQKRFPSVKTYHLTNGVDTSQFSPDGKASELGRIVGQETGTLVLYAGLHGLAQGLGQVLQAAEALRDVKEVRFVFIGDGPEKASLVEQARTCGLNNVYFLDPVSKERMPSLLASADICLVPLKTYIPGAVPSKMYEAMACGRPVILVGEGEAAEIIRTRQVGIVCRPEDTEGLVEAIRCLAEDKALRERFGKAGRRTAEQTYNREEIARKFVEFLEDGNRITKM